ncbi:MAG: peptidoglycan-binding protein, partial [Methylocystis sp.]
MSKAKFPDQGRSDSGTRAETRESGRAAQGHAGETSSEDAQRRDAGGARTDDASEARERKNDLDSIWRSIAELSKRRVDGQLGEQPSANARPIRSALAELESRLGRPPSEDRRAKAAKKLNDLDQHLAGVSQRLDEREARGDASARRPLLDAIAELRRSQRTRDDAGVGSEPVSEFRFGDLQRAIDSVAQRLDSFSEDAAERGDQQLVMMRQIENVRREIRDMTQAIGELAPRASVAAVETAMDDLRERIELQRDRGASDEALAPAERMIGELRATIEDLDPTPIVRNLRSDVETIGIRLEKLQTGDVANTAAVRDLARDTHDIREQLTALIARPLPLERIETRIIDVAQRVDALTLSHGASGAELGEVVKTIRAIVATETGKGFETFNKRLERLARKLDEVVEQSAAARFDEIGARIDELGKTLVQRIDRGAANVAPLESLIASLAKKIDSALERGDQAAAFEEIGRRFDLLDSRVAARASTESLARIEALLAEQDAERHFADLTRHIDELRQTIAAQTERVAEADDAKRIAAIEDLICGLDRKVGAAIAADARSLDLKAVERQLAQLSFKIDRLDDPFAAPRLNDQNSRIDEIAERLDRMHAAFAQSVEEGAEKRDGELTALVETLADRLNLLVGPTAGSDGLKALETQIDALALRLERIDAGKSAPVDFDSKMNDLLARLEDTRSEATQAAGAAVRAVASDILGQAASIQPGAVRAALQRELSEFRKTQDANGQRTNETLSALQRTLERVVDRLDGGDDQSNETRGVAPQAEPHTTAGAGINVPGEGAEAPIVSASQADQSGALALVDPMEFLLPVGERREPFIAPPGVELDQAGGRSSVQSDFIAAARRAARPAAVSDASAADAEGASGTPDDAPPGGAVVKFTAVLHDRKRPLLLGLGAVMLLIGAYQVARLGVQNGLTVAPSLNQQEARAPAKAVRPTRAPESKLASKRAPSQKIADLPATGETGARPPRAETSPPASAAPSVAARSIDPTPTGTIEAPPLSPGDALATIKLLAVEGDPGAQYELGARFSEGRGAPRDAKAAAHWFEKAAETGLAPAQYRLGSIYERGLGVARDYARAR